MPPLIKAILSLLFFIPLALFLFGMLGALIFHNVTSGIIAGIVLTIWGVIHTIRQGDQNAARRQQMIAQAEAEAEAERQHQEARDNKIRQEAVREYQSYLAQQQLLRPRGKPRRAV